MAGSIVLLQMAGTHLMVQLYREYLNRGGQPPNEDDMEERDGAKAGRVRRTNSREAGSTTSKVIEE
jgi:hypothetical protein